MSFSYKYITNIKNERKQQTKKIMNILNNIKSKQAVKHFTRYQCTTGHKILDDDKTRRLNSLFLTVIK